VAVILYGVAGTVCVDLSPIHLVDVVNPIILRNTLLAYGIDAEEFLSVY
jgi:hypothetical protein